MLDDLRNSSAFLEEEEPEQEQQELSRRPARKPTEPFLGMTAPQRFVLALMLFFMVCMLGSFTLVLTGKMIFPVF